MRTCKRGSVSPGDRYIKGVAVRVADRKGNRKCEVVTRRDRCTSNCRAIGLVGLINTSERSAGVSDNRTAGRDCAACRRRGQDGSANEIRYIVSDNEHTYYCDGQQREQKQA